LPESVTQRSTESPQIIDCALLPLRPGPNITIASLGPAGTSSEDASHFLMRYLRTHGHGCTGVQLYDRYEDACESLTASRAGLLVVANAYAGIGSFYMNPNLALATVFIKDTPRYGLAGIQDVRPRVPVRVATHPAPEPLITELLPPECHVASVVMAGSTSAAAAAARAGEVDLALTTEPAARLYDLRFISARRPIRMVWSAFAHADLLRKWQIA
jgi:hypothetical protein